MTRQLGTHQAATPSCTHARRPQMMILLLAVFVATLMAAAPAFAATVSGNVSNGTGYHVLLVQANGVTKKANLMGSSGAFAISGVRLNGASLQIVKADGSYYGPIVLKAKATKAFIFIKGPTSVKIGSATLKDGYALVARMPAGRYQTAQPYTATAIHGKPIGAGKLGRVHTPNCLGFKGPGGDLDRDGIISAFDVDDNGNKILDNLDRSGRGSSRPLPPQIRLGAGALLARDAAGSPLPGSPPSNEFYIFSNFKLTTATSINADIPGIGDIGALVAQYLPGTLTLATQVMGGQSATSPTISSNVIE